MDSPTQSPSKFKESHRGYGLVDTEGPLATGHMNILSLAAELVKLLQEQISILSTIKSLNESLEKLLAQKELPQYWHELGIPKQPHYEFSAIISEKASTIKTELKKLR